MRETWLFKYSLKHLLSELCKFCFWSCHCEHSLTPPTGNRERRESGIYLKIFEKTQYSMNTLYLYDMIILHKIAHSIYIMFLNIYINNIPWTQYKLTRMNSMSVQSRQNRTNHAYLLYLLYLQLYSIEICCEEIIQRSLCASAASGS